MRFLMSEAPLYAVSYERGTPVYSSMTRWRQRARLATSLLSCLLLSSLELSDTTIYEP